MMKLVETKLNGLKFWYRTDDKFVGQRIALGKYEEYETILMLKQVSAKGGQAVAVDVGANIGYYTLLLASKCKKVYAIEPDHETFLILKKNVEVNNLKNIVLLNVAASDKSENRKLIIDYNNRGNNKLSSKDCHGLRPRNDDMVKCERLDEILRNEQKVDLIKVDTQGWESAVIKGAKKILKRDLPTIFLEYCPTEYSDNKMIEYLKNVYKNIWSIDYWFYICKKGIHVNKKTGYVDLMFKNKINIRDLVNKYKYLRIKKVIKAIINYVQN